LGREPVRRNLEAGQSTEGGSSLTLIYEEVPNGHKRRSDAVDAQGRRTGWSYTAYYDEKDYPTNGHPEGDSISLKRIDHHTVLSTLKKEGRILYTNRLAISDDGKKLTNTITRKNAGGNVTETVSVYEKQIGNRARTPISFITALRGG
jgi:hypothetical protein